MGTPLCTIPLSQAATFFSGESLMRHAFFRWPARVLPYCCTGGQYSTGSVRGQFVLSTVCTLKPSVRLAAPCSNDLCSASIDGGHGIEWSSHAVSCPFRFSFFSFRV